MHYVVSDVHGHPESLLAALRQADLLDTAGSWSGGESRLTFMGDYLDRGPDGIAVVDLVRRLQGEAVAMGGRVDAMIGNHEVLALGMSRFGDQPVRSEPWGGNSFAHSWAQNGGRLSDQQRLTDKHREWLSGLDAVVLTGPDLLLHSDTTTYLLWGHTIGQINDEVRRVLADGDLEEVWSCWVRLTARHAFAGRDGEQVAAGLLDELGGERIVHGHSIIATLSGQESAEVTGPLSYAGGRVLAIDGGIYAGGPCLVVRLDDEPASTS
ncbi:metallophosphoesterase [Lapillicoccus sp.]|uniref:metallophosphoesterase n=1 Tax=Lapillicoccus sp. TaxID=1909287 RepID=UPI00398322D5